MKRLISLILLVAAPLIGLAGPGTNCDVECKRNVHEVFHGPTQYTMTADAAAHARIHITWKAKRSSKLKPVSFVGTAPVRLRHTTLQSISFAGDGLDVCHAVVTLLEVHGDDIEAYQVPVKNTQCN